MHYEINVSKNGQHYFATAPRSLTEGVVAHDMAAEFLVRFPKSEGFVVTMTRWETKGTPIKV